MTEGEWLRRSRWRWRYEIKQTQRRSRSWWVAAPGSLRVGRSLWICSWQRSGSTWLAEMLAASRTTRLVYEPANLSEGVFDGVHAARVALPRPGDGSERDVVDALRGRLRGTWVDQLNHAHLVRHLVVKDVRAVALAGEVHAAVPGSPVVILMRHPLAIVRSISALGWHDARPLAEVAEAEIAEWCELHAAALSDPRLSDAHFVTYESLVADPERVRGDVLDYASRFDSSWSRLDVTRRDPRAPSATDFNKRDQSPVRPGPDIARGLETMTREHLCATGLDEIYGTAMVALRDPNDVARTRRARASD